jgi:ribosomal protein S12 methylthiotransferase
MSARKVYFVSLGCPKNQVDTEVMLGVVHEGGHAVVDSPELADTLVVNTCGFIESAKEESIETILELAQLKQEQPGRKLVVAGCLSQRYATELAEELPEVDHFLGSADMLGLANVLGGRAPRQGVTPLHDGGQGAAGKPVRRAYLYDHRTPRRLSGPRHSAYVKIAEGCDRPCAFCIIPKLRGAQRSREIYSVVEEVHGLVEQGTREICLVAQDLTTYGKDLEPRCDLEALLDALVRIDGLEWIRLHYAYPTTTTDGLIQRIAGEPKIATYIDVPLQHIDSNVLKKMRRGYTEARVRELVGRLRDPSLTEGKHIWLRTTMLVGHPGETEEAFRRLYDFVEEAQIDHLGVFPWSREEGTASAMQPGRVTTELAQERAEVLMSRQAELRAESQQTLLGQSLRVLIDGPSEDSDFLLDGRHEGQAPGIDGKVVLTDGTGERGSFVEAIVTQAGPHDLVASMDPDAAREALAEAGDAYDHASA